MALTESQVKVFAAELQTSLKSALVFAGPKATNRKYEGLIRATGDSVKIRSISRPTIATYTKGSTQITPETLTDAERTLEIDQANYFAFEVDDVDMAQVMDGRGIMSEAADEAAYGLADAADEYVAALYANADSDNKISSVKVDTAVLAIQKLLDLKTKLDTANVPTQSRYVIIPPWYLSLLLQSSTFVSVADSGSTESLRNGEVGRAFGFDVFVSNNLIVTNTDAYQVSAGYTGAITFATQINKVESFRPQSAFSDAVKGLNLYGAKVARPKGIATLIAKMS